MRILHINNVANNAVELRNAQRKLGHVAEVVETWRGMLPYQLDEDYRFYGDDGMGSRLHMAFGLVNLARKFDVVHVHGNFPAPLLGLIKRIARRSIVCNMNGTREWFPDWKAMIRWADRIWVPTPNLLAHYPGSQYVPDPRSILSLRRMGSLHSSHEDDRPQKKVRVVHAHSKYPNAEAVKGSDSIRKCLEDIDGVEFIEVQGKTYQEALAIYVTADIAVDQMRIGWHGAFAIECMLMGIPTLGFLDPLLPEPFLNPVFPTTFKTLRNDVRNLAQDATARIRLGASQQEFVRYRHDPIRIAKWTIQHYPR